MPHALERSIFVQIALEIHSLKHVMQTKQRINKGIRVRTADMACHFVNVLHRAKAWRKIAIQKRVQAALSITMER